MADDPVGVETPPPPLKCLEFLKPLGLEQYAHAFDAAGVDNLDSLRGATVAELRSETYGPMTK